MRRPLPLIVLYETALLIGVLHFGTTDVGKGISSVAAAIVLAAGSLAVLVALAGWIGQRAATVAMLAVAASLIAAGVLSVSGTTPASGLGLAAFGVVLSCLPWALRERR